MFCYDNIYIWKSGDNSSRSKVVPMAQEGELWIGWNNCELLFKDKGYNLIYRSGTYRLDRSMRAGKVHLWFLLFGKKRNLYLKWTAATRAHSYIIGRLFVSLELQPHGELMGHMVMNSMEHVTFINSIINCFRAGLIWDTLSRIRQSMQHLF